jgi:hypothetical protein
VAHLINISTRCYVGSGSSIAIAGLILNQPSKIVIRGLGPTLANYGVDNVLTKPVLSLFNGAGQQIATNTGWQSDATQTAAIKAAFTDVGANALNSADDSAIVINLPAGGYTAQLS